ncbi:hypothetical protein ACROYT_G005946 [Oculina patagonica]
MNNHRTGRQSKYDKEMDHAFTLIFHNIKRLQDGHLCSSASDEAEMNPASTLKLPLQRPRAISDPLNGLAEGTVGQHMKASDTRPKSQSFTSGASPSPQRRKVTFSDDYTAKKEIQRKQTRYSTCHFNSLKEAKILRYDMRNHKGDSQNMNNCSTKRHNKYDKEMDHAFTLIFHNIKRLQDGRLCNSTPSLDQVDVQSEIKPAMALKVPFHRARCRSDPSLGLPEEDMAHRVKLSGARAKSGSFCGSDASPLQRRKVRFADDYATKDKLKPPPLTKRPWSDLQPLIVVTKES